jgi:hypothetical protein
MAAKATALKAAADVAKTMTPPVDKALGELARLEMPDTAGPDRHVRTILVPEPPNGTLTVEAPRLWRVRRPAELAAVLGTDPPAPTVDRAFVRTERLFLRFAVTGDLAVSSTVSVRLLGVRGARLTELPVKADGAGWLIDFPLATIARGDYVIAIEAVSGTSRASALVPIRITSG